MRRLTRMMLLGDERPRRRPEPYYPMEHGPRDYIPDYQPPYMGGWDAYISSRPDDLPRRAEPRPMQSYYDEGEHWGSRPIGFGHDWGRMGGADATVRRYREMDRLPGNRAASGHMDSTVMAPMDMATAEEWTQGMCNADGTKGPHWSVEQVRQVIAQRGLNVDLPAFYAALNSIYSDYVAVAKNYGIGDKMGYYVDMALAWLEDEDAVPDKASAYYQCIVKH